MKLNKYDKLFKKIILLLIMCILFTSFTGCSMMPKKYENKKYYAVNSLLQTQIVFPSDEELQNTNYLTIKDDVLYVWKDGEVSNFYKLEIIDDTFIFFESESVKGQIKNNCIEIYYIYTLYYYTEDYIKEHNRGN